MLFWCHKHLTSAVGGLTIWARSHTRRRVGAVVVPGKKHSLMVELSTLNRSRNYVCSLDVHLRLNLAGHQLPVSTISLGFSSRYEESG